MHRPTPPLRRFLVGAPLLLTAALAAPACATDPADAESGTGTVVSPVYMGDDILADMGVADTPGLAEDLKREFQFTSVAEPYPAGDVAACKGFVEASDPIKAIHDCSCDECGDLQRQCDALEGCQEIARCAIEIGCSDPYSCYLLPVNGKCIPIIDKWGNTGLHTAISNRLGECTTAKKCR
ncbi:MAG: hypothetical protein FJ104_07835 [Deltaproteobacteria bacterium]|nr:hypothetical protein [Deltaproteobacteria bacterium]